MTREYFASLEPRPDDPILGLVELYKNDPRDTKVNLGVGIYLDNEGRLPLMKAVGAAEQRLAQRGAPHGYIPMSGLPAYCAAIQKLVFGATNEAVLSGRIATIQSLGGTGALRLGAVFAHEYLGLTSLDHPLLSSKMSSIFRRRRCVSAKALSQWPRAVLI